MTVTQAQRARHARFLPGRAALAGLAAGLLAASAAQAAPMPAAGAALPLMAASQLPAAADPARQLPGAVSVSKIDFRRGEGGAGQLVLSFSNDGATPDLRNESSGVVIDIGNASLPPSLQKPLDVTDFATPVQRIDANRIGNGTRVVLDTRGAFESMAYQTGNDYIVEVMPRAAAAAATAVTATGQVVGSATTVGERSYSGRPVTFNFQDVPVRAVLQIIAEEAKLNLVASDTVSGNVTLRLINVPWDQALDIVLRAKGLDKRRSGNVIWVAPQSEIAKYEQDIQNARLAIENSAEMVTEYIPISYGNAEDIANLLTENSKGGSGAAGPNAVQGGRGFLSPRGSLSFDQRTNTLLVIDIPKRVEDIRQLVNELDKPVDQVVIEARIVVANESFARELGARFGISGATGKPGDRSSLGYGGDLDSSGSNAQSRADAVMEGERAFDISRSLMTNLPSTLGGSGALALSILNAGHMLDIELSALQQEGRGEVISNPRIVTSNQKEAVIKQGEEVGYLTITGSTGGAAQVPQVQFKEALLELRVTPTITNDGRVFLEMHVQKDEVAGFVDTGVGQVPRIAKRSVDTAVLMEDGQTVVIGGVYEFKDQQDLAKIPFLADIPVLGNLFKRRGRDRTKAELLIMVTPKVIRVAQHRLH